VPSFRTFSCAIVTAAALAAGLASPAAAAAPTVTPKWSTHDRARIDWTAISGAKYYKVNYSQAPDFTGGLAKFSTSGSIILTSLKAKTTYFVRVRAINANKVVISDWSATKSFTTKAPPVNVVAGSFNIKDPDSSSAVRWNSRRPYIANDIQGAYLDVLGTQEAYEEDEQRQLLASVNATGTRDYTMTPDPSSGAAWDNRILYQHAKVQLVQPAAVFTFKKQATTDPKKHRKAVYATFEKYGKRFFFVSTHLAPGNDAVSAQQWAELLYLVKNKWNPNRYPVIVVGDFNSTKFGYEACKMLKPMRDAGFGDVLGQQCKTYTTIQQRAVTKTYAHVNSFNSLNPNIADYSVGAGRIGNNVDWIFASNHLKVPQWRTHVTQSGGKLTWPIRSDHFMVSAVITLP
jgi:endonuclease/exonuclease/phosphatase family metal-dependent hydrolase